MMEQEGMGYVSFLLAKHKPSTELTLYYVEMNG